jgi:hypothetical protein
VQTCSFSLCCRSSICGTGRASGSCSCTCGACCRT